MSNKQIASNLHLKPKPTLQDIQQYVRDMEQERGFDGNTILQRLLLLTEEVGELAKAIRKSHAGMRLDGAKDYQLSAAGEIADVMILLASIANWLDVDIEQAFRDKEEQNKQRVWQ